MREQATILHVFHKKTHATYQFYTFRGRSFGKMSFSDWPIFYDICDAIHNFVIQTLLLGYLTDYAILITEYVLTNSLM